MPLPPEQVARLKGELGSQPPLTRGAEQELAAVQASRAARLADTVRSHCKKAVLHITAHKVGLRGPGVVVRRGGR